MAKILHASDGVRNAAVDAAAALLNGGTIKVYTGSMPSTPATAVTTQTLLATLTFGNPAFGSAVSGTATANAITDDSSADATGTATWARLSTSGGTAVFDVNVGQTGDNTSIEFNTTSFVAGAEIKMTSCTLSMGSGA